MKMIAIAIAALLASSAANAETFAIQAGRLIVDAAKPARGPSTVIVDNGRIVRIEDGATAPAGATVVDLRSKTVMPGLIDVHVHLTGKSGEPWYQSLTPKYSEPYAATVGLTNALTMARAGFTTVRDLGGQPLASLAMRDALREGAFPGPRVMVSGPSLSIIGGHGDATVGLNPELGAAINEAQPQVGVCTGVQQCSEAVRKIGALGVDVIKFHATGGVLDPGAMGLEQHFSDAEIKAIVDTAHAMGLKAAAHAHGTRGIEAATRAGVDSIEHGTFADAAAIEAMRRGAASFVPTLMAYTGIREGLAANRYTPPVAQKVRETLELVGRAARAARAAGVPVIFGTDAGVYEHGRNAQEFAQLVELVGMTPAQALASATTGAARLLGMESEVGRIASGLSADLIAVDGDPLTDIRVLERVAFAMVRGRPAE